MINNLSASPQITFADRMMQTVIDDLTDTIVSLEETANERCSAIDYIELEYAERSAYEYIEYIKDMW